MDRYTRLVDRDDDGRDILETTYEGDKALYGKTLAVIRWQRDNNGRKEIVDFTIYDR